MPCISSVYCRRVWPKDVKDAVKDVLGVDGSCSDNKMWQHRRGCNERFGSIGFSAVAFFVRALG